MYWAKLFAMMKLNVPMEEQGFFVSDKFSFNKDNDLIVSVDNKLESTFVSIILLWKRSFLCECIYEHPQILRNDFMIIIYNPVQNIFEKRETSSKVVKDHKTLISAFS